MKLFLYAMSLFAVIQIAGIAVLKYLILPFLMAACAKICNLDPNRAMSLVLLTLAPASTTSFVLALQYNHGTEVVTVLMVLGTLIMTPVLVIYLKLFEALGIFDYTLLPPA